MIFYTKSIVFLAAAICHGALPCPGKFAFAQGPSEVEENSGSEKSSETIGYEASFPALGTLVQIKVFSNDAAAVQRAIEEIKQESKRLESILTDYDSESETRQLTSAAFQHPTAVSEPLWQVLVASDSWHQRTDGAFDSSLGKLTQLWRKVRRLRQLPSQEQVQAALKETGWQYVRLDMLQRTVEFSQAGLQLDFGAIGKGYVADRIYDLLLKHDLPCCLVNISGNMRLGSPPPNREGWRIEISPLEKDGEPLRRVVLSNKAIATSGDLWQFVVIDGVRRSHVLDPKSGFGVPGPIAATVIAETATDADAFATAACVLGPSRAIQFAEANKVLELLIASRQTEQMTVVQTEAFPKN